MPLVFNTDRERMVYLTQIRVESMKIPCHFCGEKFLPEYWQQVYCNPKCQRTHAIKKSNEEIRKRVIAERDRWCEMIMKKVNESIWE